MASRPRMTLSPETLTFIYQFLPDDKNRSNFEKTCLNFRNICLASEVKNLQEIIELENRYLQSPLNEEGVPEEVIERVERKIGFALPFHLREFIKITNGRRMENLMGWHWSCLAAFQDWRFHSPQKVQIGRVTDGSGIFVDLKSGLISVEGVKSGGMNFKQWMQFSACGRQLNIFSVQKLLENEKDLRIMLKRYGYLYECLSETQKNDKSLINLAMQSFPILRFIPTSIGMEKSLVQSAIQYQSENYTHLSDSLKKDKDIIKQFIERGGSLSNIPGDLITNDLILESFRQGSIVDETILRKSKVSDDFLIKLIEIVKPSSNQIVKNFMEEQSKKLSEKVLKQIMELDPVFMSMIGKGDKMNKKVALKIFETRIYDSSHLIKIFNGLSKELQTDREVAERAVLAYFDIYPMLDDSLKKDKSFNLQLLTKWLQQSNTHANNFQELKPLYDLWKDEEFLRLAFNSSPEFIIDYPVLVDETFINSLKTHYGKLTFGEILKVSPYEGYRLAVRRNKSHPAHDLVEAKDTLKDIRKALPKEEDPETLADIRQSLLSSVWYDYW